MDDIDVEAILAQDVTATRLADKREFSQRMVAYLRRLDEMPALPKPQWREGQVAPD